MRCEKKNFFNSNLKNIVISSRRYDENGLRQRQKAKKTKKISIFTKEEEKNKR